MQNILKPIVNSITEQQFLVFLKQQGIIVKTNTKARGHLGICYKNRIDISIKANKERRLSILAHEYAHKVHLDLEKDPSNQGGSLQKLFNYHSTELIRNELLRVTHFTDENSLFIAFYKRKEEIKNEIEIYEKIIKFDYPDFKRSQEFKPILAFFKKNKSNARHLLKYNNIKIINNFFKKDELISIKNLDHDFPSIPESLRAYIKLNSLQKEQKKLSARKNKTEKYYNRPTELFARFVEGLFIDPEMVKTIAPFTYKRFDELLKSDYYGKLNDLLILAKII